MHTYMYIYVYDICMCMYVSTLDGWMDGYTCLYEDKLMMSFPVSAEAGTPYNGSVMAVNDVGTGDRDPQVFFVGEARELTNINYMYMYVS